MFYILVTDGHLLWLQENPVVKAKGYPLNKGACGICA
jgi:hypothetical protein